MQATKIVPLTQGELELLVNAMAGYQAEYCMKPGMEQAAEFVGGLVQKLAEFRDLE